MTLAPLPINAMDAQDWPWSNIAPYYQSLQDADLNEATIDHWLKQWTEISDFLGEIDNRLYVAVTLNTADKTAEQRVQRFAREIMEPCRAAEDGLRQKLLASGLVPAGMETPVKMARAESEIFRTANLPRFTQMVELGQEYDKICGARSVTWDGEEVTLAQIDLALEESDRSRREAAWRLKHDRILADREALNGLWGRMKAVRHEIAQEAGKPTFTQYMWAALHRFDYTEEDCASFRKAILETVVPAAREVYRSRKEALGLDSLKPWDLDVDPLGAEPLRPFQDEAELTEKSRRLFARIDSQLATWFDDMVTSRLIDLFSRKNKSDGGYCTSFPRSKQPFVFMNAVGSHDDLQTLIHEAGHCFHVYSTNHLPYSQQTHVGSEFAEVASMGMEMLAQPHLGEFYDEKDSARAQIQHLEKCLLFWPYMAVVDGFQHWAYAAGEAGNDPAACDAEWSRLWDLYMAGIDYSGLEDIKATGWHRKLHIFQVPFYYVEYGLAQMGAVQVWLNARRDEAEAVRKYREALALGCTVGLPKLFEAAGGRFAFDTATLGSLVDAMTGQLAELRKVV